MFLHLVMPIRTFKCVLFQSIGLPHNSGISRVLEPISGYRG